jgi:hypothetical protein
LSTETGECRVFIIYVREPLALTTKNATNRYVIRRTVAVAVAVAVAGVGVGVGVLNIERSPLDFVFLAESAVESRRFRRGADCILSLSSMIFTLIKVGY